MKKLSLDQMENIQGGLPCGVALALYGAAFIGAAAATGGAAIALGLFSLGGTIWEVIESCRYKL